jgi:MFS family permease
MVAGALAFRVPPPGYRHRPSGAPTPLDPRGDERPHVHLDNALRTPQFYLLWLALFLNVTAGIGVLGPAAFMIQDVFDGRVDASMAAGFVGLLSLFNMVGRFLWSTVSDRVGRKATYGVFFALGAALYLVVPVAGHAGRVPAYVGACAAILTLYGGGFATIPAYLADLFGEDFVGAIHGRVLTAWSAAGLVGPALVATLRDRQVAEGVPRAHVYDATLHVMAALLAVGFVANLLVRPVAARYRMTDVERADARKQAISNAPTLVTAAADETPLVVVLLAWAAVLAPLTWGVAATLLKASALFR